MKNSVSTWRFSVRILCMIALLISSLPLLTAKALVSNVALNKTVTCSSIENAGTPCASAVDGNTGTRWASAFSDPQWIQVDLGAVYTLSSVTLRWETAAGKNFQIQASNDAANWTTLSTVTNGTGGNQTLTVSGNYRYVRMYGTARTTAYGYSLWELEVLGDVPSTPTTPAPTGNLAQGKPVTCSSIENAGTPCASAVDGNTGTRWASAFSDPQWIYVDFGSSQTIKRVVLTWEAAFGKSYQVQTSNDAATWTTIYTTTTGDGGTDDLAVNGTGRYLRVYGTVRATAYGYSLFELAVYATNTVTPTPVTPTPITPTPTTPPNSCTTTSNIALNHPAYAWYWDNGGGHPKYAVDGDAATRYSHLWYPSGPATGWWYVDLGSTAAVITKINITWEAALAADFTLQTSNDAANWTTIQTVTGNTSLSNSYTYAPAKTGRYVRINLNKKGSAYGYSFYEFQVIGCNGAAASYTATPAPLSGNYSLVWSDNFDGTTLNAANWVYDNNVHVNGEAQQYASNNVTVSGGVLKLTAKKEVNNGYQFTSGRIITKGLKDWRYGKFVARMILPVGPGYWPAFWLMGSDIDTVGWPGNGELDIMENIGYADWVSGALHGPGYWGAGSIGGTHVMPSGTINTWHTYSVEWDPTYIKWYIDDVLMRTVTRADVNANGSQWTYDNPKFILLNLALGGDYPQGWNGCTGNPMPAGCFGYGLPQSTVDNIIAGGGVVQVDYVQVWQKP